MICSSSGGAGAGVLFLARAVSVPRSRAHNSTQQTVPPMTKDARATATNVTISTGAHLRGDPGYGGEADGEQHLITVVLNLRTTSVREHFISSLYLATSGTLGQ